MVAMNFDQAIERVLTNEGGYSNDLNDGGGETNWGVTFAVARQYGYQGAMRDMTRDQAIAIYRVGFWQRVHADELPLLLAFQALDFGVNCGIDTAVRKLQAAAGVADDGKWGPITRAAVQAMPPVALTFRFFAEELDYRRKLSKWPRYGSGWTARVANDMRYAATDLLGATT